MTISRAQVKGSSRSRGFLTFTADQLLGFRLDRRLNLDYYSGAERGSAPKGNISVQINPWRVVDFLPTYC